MVEWIAIVLSAFLFVGAVVAEVLWLVRKGVATSGRAVAYVVMTDLLGFGIVLTIVLTVFFILFMIVMGPDGMGSSGSGAVHLGVLAIAIIFPPVLFIVIKRVFLSFLKIQTGSSAWIYSIVSSLLILIVVFVPPPLVYYLIVNLSKWK